MLQKAVESCLQQTVKDIQIFIVDDGSTDGTQDYALAMLNQDHRIRYVRNDVSQGAPTARNIALREAAGVYVTGLDDDDYFLDRRIERLLAAQQQGRTASVAAQDFVIRDKDKVPKVKLWKPDTITIDDLKYYNCLGNQILAPKDVFNRLGGFDPNLPAAQDYDLWIRLVSSYGPVHVVPEPLQVILLTNGHHRIANSGKKHEGYEAFLTKHAAMASPDVRFIRRFLMFPSASVTDGARALASARRAKAPYHVWQEVLKRIVSQQISKTPLRA
jgi:glycosyltransferase involved in cell wall biosynthesis